MVVDDHAMVRQGLSMYFEDDSDIDIVCEARNGEEAVDLGPRLCPQVILMDMLMPAMDGAEAIGLLRKLLPQTHIVAMTSVVEEHSIHRAIEAGAIGYVLKDTRPEELREAVLAAAEGRVRFAADSAGRLMRDVPTPDVDPQALTANERRMLHLLSLGKSCPEIAEQMNCAPEEIEEGLDALLERLSLAGRAQAVLYATRKGLVPAGLRPYLG
jgi:DNA-binding NarL/FixJ family response regulator